MSSTGWGIGYLGGGLLLALNLALFAKAKALGLSEAHGGADQSRVGGRLVGDRSA